MAHRQFSDTLNALRFGTLNDELGKELAALANRCEATGKKGRLTITIDLKPGKAGQIEVVDDYNVKAPKEQRGTTLMFATVEGNLTREDPRQSKLELRSVDTSTGELRSINS